MNVAHASAMPCSDTPQVPEPQTNSIGQPVLHPPMESPWAGITPKPKAILEVPASCKAKASKGLNPRHKNKASAIVR